MSNSIAICETVILNVKSQIEKRNDGIEKCICISIFTLHWYCIKELFCKCMLLSVNVMGLLNL